MRLNKRNLSPTKHRQYPSQDDLEKDNVRAASAAAGAAHSCEPSASRSRPNVDALGRRHGGER